MKSTITIYLVLGSLLKFFYYGLISSTYSVYLQRGGLDLFEINLVNVSFYVTMFLFEIPTGAFADVFGRKLSFVASCFTLATGCAVYGLSSGFWGFIVAEIIAAIGATFSTGAFEAWLVDNLKHEKQTVALKKVFAWSEFWAQGAVVSGTVCGAYLATYNMRIPWLVGGVGSFIVGVLALRYMKEPTFTPKSLGWNSGWQEMKATVKTSVHYGLKNPVIRYIIVVASLQTFVLMTPNMQWSLWFGNYVKTEVGLGYVMAGNVVFMMLGSRLVGKILDNRFSEEMIIVVLQIAMGIAFVVTVLCSGLWGLIPFYVHQVFRGFWKPVKQAYLHDHIDSKDRATVVSFESIAYHISGALGLLLSGLLAKYFGIQVTWILAGLVLIFGTSLVYWKRK